MTQSWTSFFIRKVFVVLIEHAACKGPQQIRQRTSSKYHLIVLLKLENFNWYNGIALLQPTRLT